MTSQRLLYLTQHQVLAYQWKGGRCVPEGEFTAEVAGTEFVAYLRGNKTSLFSIVANLPEEGFQLETIPFLNAKDREAIISRRLGQTFIHAPLTVAMSLGYEKTTRKNERLLLAAITSASILNPWLQALQNSEARVVGIYSLPLLSLPVLEKLGIPKERSILVTVQDHSIRQTFFNKGHLAFSRVAPIPNSSVSGLAQVIGNEVARLHQYLLSQRMIGRGESLQAHVLADSLMVPALKAVAFPETLRLQTHSIADLYSRFGISGELDDSRAEFLFLHLAASQPPRQQFASDLLRKEYRLWQAGKIIRAVGSIVLAGCLLLTAKLSIDRHYLQIGVEEHLVAAKNSEAYYRAIVDAFPKLPLSQDNLRQVTDRVVSIQRHDVVPEPILTYLSIALSATPQIEVKKLAWNVEIVERAPEKRASAQQSGSVSDREVLAVSGMVQLGSSGTPRQLLSVFEDFLKRLRVDPAYSVQVGEQPFDTGSDSALKSGGSETSVDHPKSFTLSISRKLAP